jgi:hypothetical protein
LAFKPWKLIEGVILRFGVARHEQHSSYSPSPTGTGGGASNGGGSADLLGQGVLLPSGQIVGPGATFTARFQDGTTIDGVFTKTIGAGWTPVDGYGFINAEAAVGQ